MGKKFRITDADMDAIKIQGLKEFINFNNKQPFKKRLNLALLIIFKRLKL